MSEEKFNEKIKKLVQQAQKGDPLAYGRLFRKFYKKIYNYISFRVSQREDVEDLTTKVFLKGWENIQKYKEIGFSFSTWLYRIAHNLVIDYFRTYKISGELEEIEFKLASENNFERRVEEKESMNLLREEIKKLPDLQGQVVLFKFIEDKNYKEIGEILGKDEGAIRALQFRAIKTLRERFKIREEGMKNE